MEKEWKKGDRVKIEGKSEAALDVFRNDEKRKKWENTERIGFVIEVTTAPARNKLVRVGTHPEDSNPDGFFPGDLRDLKPDEGILYIVIDYGEFYGTPKKITVCTSREIADYMKSKNEAHSVIISIPTNKDLPILLP